MFYASLGFALEVAAAIQSSTMATTVSTIGTDTAVYVGGNRALLPKITITENYVGGLKPNAFIAIGSDFDQIASFDISAATLKAYRLGNNAEITSAIIGDNTLSVDPAPSRTNIADVVFKLKAGSNSETGPIKIIISYLIATLADSSNGEQTIYGGQTIKIGGSDTSGASLDTLDKINSNLGSGTSAQTLTLKGGIACPAFAGLCGSLYDNVVISGPITARTFKAKFYPPGRDQGRQGSVYIAALLPLALGGNIYFMSDVGAWTIFTSCETAPAYFSGPLTKLTDIPIVPTPTDLTSLMHTQIYLGWGIADADVSPGTACRNMLYNGNYSLTYTVFDYHYF